MAWRGITGLVIIQLSDFSVPAFILQVTRCKTSSILARYRMQILVGKKCFNQILASILDYSIIAFDLRQTSTIVSRSIYYLTYQFLLLQGIQARLEMSARC